MSMDLAARLKMVREFRNYTQSYLAKELGISQNTYSKIESGHIAITTQRLEKIAAILSIDILEIMDESSAFLNLPQSPEKRPREIVGSTADKIIQLLEEEVKYLREQNRILVNAFGNRE